MFEGAPSHPRTSSLTTINCRRTFIVPSFIELGSAKLGEGIPQRGNTDYRTATAGFKILPPMGGIYGLVAGFLPWVMSSLASQPLGGTFGFLYTMSKPPVVFSYSSIRVGCLWPQHNSAVRSLITGVFCYNYICTRDEE